MIFRINITTINEIDFKTVISNIMATKFTSVIAAMI